MDDVRRVNGPGSMGRQGSNGRKRLGKQMKVLIGIVAGIVLLVAGGLAGWLLYQSSTAAQIDTNRYQALFLTNGQVYFGKLQNLNGTHMKLTDIFYLQARSAEEDPQNPQKTTDKQMSDVQLIKLGNEIHGPDDEMVIGKDQILFFENLKKEGKVSDSITKYKSQKQ
ncbi:MAG: hypothetical protein ACREGJ_04860 [Candidatus Saccharimonadales bacterium]